MTLPPGITCPDFATPAVQPTSKRCRHYGDGGKCDLQRDGNYVRLICTEWLKKSGHMNLAQPALEAIAIRPDTESYQKMIDGVTAAANARADAANHARKLTKAEQEQAAQVIAMAALEDELGKSGHMNLAQPALEAIAIRPDTESYQKMIDGVTAAANARADAANHARKLTKAEQEQAAQVIAMAALEDELGPAPSLAASYGRSPNDARAQADAELKARKRHEADVEWALNAGMRPPAAPPAPPAPLPPVAALLTAPPPPGPAPVPAEPLDEAGRLRLVQSPPPKPRKKSAADMAREMWGVPLGKVDAALLTPADDFEPAKSIDPNQLATLIEHHPEIELASPELGTITLVESLTGKDRLEVTFQDMALIRLLVDALPGSRVVGLRRRPT